jgi:hypothetical protein
VGDTMRIVVNIRGDLDRTGTTPRASLVNAELHRLGERMMMS